MKSVRVLGIESSCDETAAAVVEGGRHILSNVVSSQAALHKSFSGVVPEIASRAHVENIQAVVETALKGLNNRGMTPFPKVLPVDVIAVTTGPGLVGSLLVGKMVAEMMAWVYQKPLIPINHLEGHALSVLPANINLEPPYLALIASGGHTELVHVKKYGVYEILGHTRDDAAGEAFDKVAKLVGLPYPGGPAVEKMAERGNPAAINFPRPLIDDGLNFSFSGLKTAVAYYVRDNPSALAARKKVADVCASFQAAVIDVLVKKTIRAADGRGLKNIIISGGVAANGALRAAFHAHSKKHKLHMSSPLLCTDNAVMIAVAGHYRYLKSASKKFAPKAVNVSSTWPLGPFAKK